MKRNKQDERQEEKSKERSKGREEARRVDNTERHMGPEESSSKKKRREEARENHTNERKVEDDDWLWRIINQKRASEDRFTVSEMLSLITVRNRTVP